MIAGVKDDLSSARAVINRSDVMNPDPHSTRHATNSRACQRRMPIARCLPALLTIAALPSLASCTPLLQLRSPAPERARLVLADVQLETPPAIAPDFQLATPAAIAPHSEPAIDQSSYSPLVDLDPSPTSPPTETQSQTATATTSSTPTSTSSATAISSQSPTSTTFVFWPTWTAAPTNTSTAIPLPTSTVRNIPPNSPLPTNTAIATNTSAPTSGLTESTPTSQPPTPTATPLRSSTPFPSGCSPSGNSGYEATLIDLINEARQANGLHPLSQQGPLTAAARQHSHDMACNDFISHTGSDGSRPADRVSDNGYSYSWVGENIFAGSSDPQSAFNWWMNSDLHRANILHSNYTEIGLGYSHLQDSRYHNHYTAVFARPR